MKTLEKMEINNLLSLWTVHGDVTYYPDADRHVAIYRLLFVINFVCLQDFLWRDISGEG